MHADERGKTLNEETVGLSVVGRLLEVGSNWSGETRVVVEYVDGAGEIRTSDMYCSKEDAMRMAKHLYQPVKLTIEVLLPKVE